MKDLQTVKKKTARDDQRWRQHLETQKQKFAIEAERFLTRKKKASAVAKEEESIPVPTPTGVEQTLYIGTDQGATVVLETTLSEGGKVLRTYNFVGAVPAEYQHLVTPDAVTWGKSTSVQKILTFDEWQDLTQTE